MNGPINGFSPLPPFDATVSEPTNLASVGVGPGVGHGQDSGLGVLELEVLVSELLAVDGLTTFFVFSDAAEFRTKNGGISAVGSKKARWFVLHEITRGYIF